MFCQVFLENFSLYGEFILILLICYPLADVNGSAVSPQMLKLIELSVVLKEDVHDNIDIVEADPCLALIALDALCLHALFTEPELNLNGKRLYLCGAGSGGDNEIAC